MPSTKTRNDIFATEATKLFIEAGRKAVENCPGITARRTLPTSSRFPAPGSSTPDPTTSWYVHWA